jgi:Ca2+-dependent lipid-binding protein
MDNSQLTDQAQVVPPTNQPTPNKGALDPEVSSSPLSPELPRNSSPQDKQEEIAGRVDPTTKKENIDTPPTTEPDTVLKRRNTTKTTELAPSLSERQQDSMSSRLKEGGVVDNLISNMPGTFHLEPAQPVPNWYLQNISLPVKDQKTYDVLDELLPSFLYGEWYHNLATLFLTALFSYILSYIGGGLGTILVMCFAIGK